MKQISGLIKRPEIVIGGTQHKKASSFMPERIAQYERQKLYREQGIVWVSPTRGTVHTSVVVSWLSLQWPMNHFRSPLITSEGMEVARAYDSLVDWSMNRRRLRGIFQKQFADMFADAPFILTTEEDNVLPSDAIPKLMTAIFTCPDCGGEVRNPEWRCENGHYGYSAVSGLYFMKCDPPIPMAFGTPNGHKKNFEFHPRSVSQAVKKGEVLEVNGIAMGCALWRKELFRQVKKPWFRTKHGWTQDLWFCKKAKETRKAHARFGVHCGVRVSHFEPMTRKFF